MDDTKLVTALLDYDFCREFFRPTKHGTAEDFGPMLSANFRQNAIFHDWTKGRFDIVAYFVPFFLGMAFSVQHSSKLKMEHNIARIFWSYGRRKLKVFILHPAAEYSSAKPKVVMKCIKFYREKIDKKHKWTKNDIADMTNQFGPVVRHSDFESHVYELTVLKEKDLVDGMDNIGLIFTSDYDMAYDIKPTLLARKMAGQSQLIEITPFIPEKVDDRFMDKHLSNLMSNPAMKNTVKLFAAEFASHLVDTYKRNLARIKYSTEIGTHLPEAQCGFVHGNLISFQKSHGFKAEVTMEVEDDDLTSEFNIFLRREPIDDLKLVVHDYPILFDIVDTNPGMNADQVEKRGFELMMDHMSVRYVSMSKSFTDELLNTYINFEAKKAIVVQSDFHVSAMDFYDLVGTLKSAAKTVTMGQKSREENLELLTQMGTFVSNQIKYEILQRMIKDELRSEGSKYVSRYMNGLLTSTVINNAEQKIYTVHYKDADEAEKQRRKSFLLDTDVENVNVMITVDEADQLSADEFTAIKSEEGIRNLPHVRPNSKFIMHVHVAVDYANDVRQTDIFRPRELSTIEIDKAAIISKATLYTANENDDYIIEPLKHLNVKLFAAIHDPYQKNEPIFNEIQKMMESKLPLFRNYHDFAAFCTGLFHDTRIVTNVAKVSPHIMQIGFLQESMYQKESVKDLVLVNFIFGESPQALEALEEVKNLYFKTRARGDEGKMITVILRPGHKEVDVFTQRHLSLIDACMAIVKGRSKRSSTTCESTELEELIEEKKRNSDAENDMVNVGEVKYRFFHQLSRISGGIMTGLMVKNLVADVINGNVAGVAINTGFILSSILANKASVNLLTKAGKFTSEGRLVLGNMLKSCAPFLARSPALLFVGYDLYCNLKNNDHSMANKVSIGGDIGYLALDITESLIELAEFSGIFEGVAAFTGPIGAALGATIMIGTEIYRAVETVKKIDSAVHLSGPEKFVEGMRAFIGMQPEEKIKMLIDNKQATTIVVQEVLKFLDMNKSVKRYVVPIKASNKHCTTDRNVNFTSKVRFQVTRAVPDLSKGFAYFCYTPDDDYCAKKSTWHLSHSSAALKSAYICTNSAGIENYGSNSTTTYYDLKNGTDKVLGFRNTPNAFNLGSGLKFVSGGDADDSFILNGNEVMGILDGRAGTNLIDSRRLNGTLFVNRLYMVVVDSKEDVLNLALEISNMTQIYGRGGQQDKIFVWCKLRSLNLFGGKESKYSDMIKVPYSRCEYDLNVTIGSHTRLNNNARFGRFRYHIESGACNIKLAKLRTYANHTFYFNYPFEQLMSIRTRKIKQKKVILRLRNRLNQKCEIRFHTSSKVLFAFEDGVHFHIRRGHVTALLNVDTNINEIQDLYATIIARSSISMVIHSSKQNTTLTLTRGRASRKQFQPVNIVHNNPNFVSHVIGSSHENVFTILPTRKGRCLEFKTVHIHSPNRGGSKALIDLTPIASRLLPTNQTLKLVPYLDKAGNVTVRIISSLPSKPTRRPKLIGTIKIIDISRNRNAITFRSKSMLKLKYRNQDTHLIPYLEPLPLKFNNSNHMVILTEHNIEENTPIIVGKNFSHNYRLFSNNKSLLITNVRFSDGSINLNSFNNNTIAIFFVNFFKSEILQSLKLKFADFEMNLNDMSMRKVEDLSVLIRSLTPNLYVWDRVKNLAVKAKPIFRTRAQRKIEETH